MCIKKIKLRRYEKQKNMMLKMLTVNHILSFIEPDLKMLVNNEEKRKEKKIEKLDRFDWFLIIYYFKAVITTIILLVILINFKNFNVGI